MIHLNYMREWMSSNVRVIVNDRLHYHYMAPMGFTICPSGICTTPKWIEGRVSDDA